MGKAPSAAAFTRTQQSWARFLQEKIRAQIEERETFLINERGWTTEQLDDDVKLLDLYDEELFWTRYEEQMTRQREYIKNHYLGGEHD